MNFAGERTGSRRLSSPVLHLQPRLAMDACDVIVVGGGPAGSTCARQLTGLGFDVVVVDRRTFPRDKTCAGWITPPVVTELELDLREYGQGRTLQPITGFRVGMIGRGDTLVRYEQPVSYGIRRCEFDHFLLERCGARLRLGRPIGRIDRLGNSWIIDGELQAPMLVGAGGHFCPVARQLSARPSGTRGPRTREPAEASVVTAQEIEFEVPPARADGLHVEPQFPEIHFCEDLQGYGWCFRKQNVLNIGLGRVQGRHIASDVAGYLEFLRERGRVNIDIPDRFHGHAYRLYDVRAPQFYDDGVMLVGDAAGLAYAQSGEGIRPAVESGLLAAAVIGNAAGRYDRDALSRYESAMLEWFGRPSTRHPAAWLPGGALRFLAARLLSSPRFVRSVVLDRWFLHHDCPPLSPPAREGRERQVTCRAVDE